jgi:hypothetical protein
VLVYLEVALVPPAIDEDSIDDRGGALRLGDDRVVKLPRTRDRAFVPDEMWLRVADPDENPGPRPRRLEDVALPLRSFAD